ncbi:MAG: helix-turn-helix domain-containing protein, partial [Mycobacterium sp.]
VTAVTADIDTMLASIGPAGDVRIAIGSTADGVEGFRRSHFDALTTQQMMARLRSPQRLAFYADIQLVALITADADRAAGFVRHVLGDFEFAEPELRDTVRTFIGEQCNASQAAARLYIHRNTLLRRLARADELLPQPLAECTVNVAVALDVLRWCGQRMIG